MIRELQSQSELETAADVIRRSFATVAEDFSLTPENCPTNPAFLTVDGFLQLTNNGVRFYGFFYDGSLVGTVGIERLNDSEYVVEKLAVLPALRHSGFGGQLLDFSFEKIREAGAEKVLIGIVDENTVLKEWYKGYGFTITGIKRFDHLPFTVCFMEKRL